MKELLEKWAKLEPGACSHSGLDHDSYYLGTPRLFARVGANHYNEHELAKILTAVMSAIEAQDWDYELRWYGTKKIAHVYPPCHAEVIRYDTDSHAESLLKSYLEALEVTQRRLAAL